MFTPAQITTIRAAIFADPVMAPAAPLGNGPDVIAALFNTVEPAYFAWRTSTSSNDVNDAIVWANLTPTDAADVTTIYTNRALVCQAKQINLRILIQGRDTVNSAKSSIRAGLQDALSLIPSGVAGATVSGGWPAVKTAMTRNATRLEKLLASGTGTAAIPANLGYDGMTNSQEMSDVIGPI